MEQLKHECGVALIRLKKPLEYYQQKYGTTKYALNKLYLLMQKQHNRGQEGAGAACVSLTAQPGEEFIFRERSEGKNAITDLFANIHAEMAKGGGEGSTQPFIGECYMGHLRYSTTGKQGLSYVHPHLRRNNYRRGTLSICGNFNLTNVTEIFEHLKLQGQHPRRTSDTTILLEHLGQSLDYNKGEVLSTLKECMPMWDGGFVMCGVTGCGEMYTVRDPWGIRTAFYYDDEEIVVIASERAAIQTVMNVEAEQIREIKPGESVIIDCNGSLLVTKIVEPKVAPSPCSFERIYFSRGSDVDIYKERKELGERIVPQILKVISNDICNSVFSFIPNTAETAFFGMVDGLNSYLNEVKCAQLTSLQTNNIDSIKSIIQQKVRIEKVAVKDIKLRTFISETNVRDELAAHVYDITYGSIIPNRDNLIVIDDSIVRGTTLKKSIITILSRLKPKILAIVSSAPQIRYPDFYGIDMSNIGDLIAFRAALALNDHDRVADIYHRCKEQQARGYKGQVVNYVQEIYCNLTDIEISKKIGEMVTPAEITVPVKIIYQTQEALAQTCPHHRGDWYFSGNYPTVGGLRMLNESFIKFIESSNYLGQIFAITD